jgi:hypothetical protein
MSLSQVLRQRRLRVGLDPERSDVAAELVRAQPVEMLGARPAQAREKSADWADSETKGE